MHKIPANNSQHKKEFFVAWVHDEHVGLHSNLLRN